MKLPLLNGTGTVSLLLTITGIFNIENSNNLEFTNENNPDPYKDKMAIKYVKFILFDLLKLEFLFIFFSQTLRAIHSINYFKI